MKKDGKFKYQQLFKALKHDIESGVLRPDEKLLSEEKLVEKYQVSRVTVRSALNALEELGYIVRTRGKGTFVRAKVMEKRVNNVISFTETNLMLGNTSSSKLLQRSLIKAPLLVVNYLDVDDEELVWAVRRIRRVNGLTALYEESYWVQSVCGDITEEDACNSILMTLAGRGVRPYFGKQEFVAISANEAIARNLEVPEHFPVLLSKVSVITKHDRPMFLGVSYYRTDRITVSATRVFQPVE